MLTATVKGFFSSRYSLYRNDEEVAMLNLSLWNETAEATIGDRRYSCYRKPRLRGTYFMEGDERRVAEATKPSIWRSRFSLTLKGRTYEMRRPSAFKRIYAILEGEQKVGEISTSGVFKREAAIDVPEEWSLPAQVFVFWLAALMWNNEDMAAVAAASAVVATGAS